MIGLSTAAIMRLSQLDPDERDAIVDRLENNRGLVHVVVSRMVRRCPPSILVEELEAAGVDGLLDACLTYDQTRAAFSTHACLRIEYAMRDHLRREGYAMRLRQSFETSIEPLLEGGDGPAPPRDRWLRDVARHGFRVFFTSAVSDGEVTDGGDSPGAIAAREEYAEHVRACISQLTTEEQEVIRVRYYEGGELQSVAQRQKVHKASITRLHRRALEHLARLLRQRLGHDEEWSTCEAEA